MVYQMFSTTHSHKKDTFLPITYLIVRLKQDLIILGKCDQENDGGDVLEAMNPLPSLRSLTTDIYHSAGGVMV